MYLMCHISRQDVIENDKKNVCVYGEREREREGGGGGGGGADALKLSIIMHFLCGRSRTRLKNSSAIWNLDLNLDLSRSSRDIDPNASNKMLI